MMEPIEGPRVTMQDHLRLIDERLDRIEHYWEILEKRDREQHELVKRALHALMDALVPVMRRRKLS